MSQSLLNLPLDELKKMLSKEKKKVRKDYKELEEKRKIIREIVKVRKIGKKIKKGETIRKKTKSKPKTFEEYFEECIKNKKIPKDTPQYLRKALERAFRERNLGIEMESSSLDGFTKKYIIKSQPGLLPNDFFYEINNRVIKFLRENKNTKIRFILNCMMEKVEKGKDKLTYNQDEAYFHSDTFSNLESTNTNKIFNKSKEKMLEGISIYQKNGSGWYLKEVNNLEINTNKYRAIGGKSYLPLPDWIMRKKAILNIKNKDNKCFLWCYLDTYILVKNMTNVLEIYVNTKIHLILKV